MRHKAYFNAIVRNVKTGEIFHTYMTKKKWERLNATDSVLCTKMTTDGVYKWYTTMYFVKSFLEYVRKEIHEVGTHDSKSFIGDEFKVFWYRNNKCIGTTYYYETFDEEKALRKKDNYDKYEIYHNEKLLSIN